MHRITCSSRFTWQQNITESDKQNSNITEATLHACASHHRDLKNTRLAPMLRWHDFVQNTCRAQPHRMHTSDMAKMTNKHVITVSTG